MSDPFALVFDLETTGINVLEDRIVTAYLGLMDYDGQIRYEKNFVVDPGIPIPDGAAAVHGYTTERVKTEATHLPAAAVGAILAIIRAECGTEDLPLVGANLAYDCSLLEAERRRHAPRLRPLRFHVEGEPAGIDSICVFDTYVADKQVDRYRKGSRKLIATARHYGIPLDEAEAHAASFDAIAAGRIALRLLQHDRMRGIPFDVIHEGLQLAHADQAASLQAYFAKSGKTNDDGTPIVCDPGWPLHSALTTTATKEEA